MGRFRVRAGRDGGRRAVRRICSVDALLARGRRFLQTRGSTRFIQDGRIALDGELPVNTFGGSLSQGRLHGMGHIAEAVLQITGRAGSRQLTEPGAIVVFDGSPMLTGGGMILTRDR